MAEAPRVALARLAERAALEDHGVESLNVMSTADAAGGYALDLRVVARPEDLHAMADRVRATVAEAATVEGLVDQIASVSVHVEDLAEPAGRAL